MLLSAKTKLVQQSTSCQLAANGAADLRAAMPSGFQASGTGWKLTFQLQLLNICSDQQLSIDKLALAHGQQAIDHSVVQDKISSFPETNTQPKMNSHQPQGKARISTSWSNPCRRVLPLPKKKGSRTLSQRELPLRNRALCLQRLDSVNQMSC